MPGVWNATPGFFCALSQTLEVLGDDRRRRSETTGGGARRRQAEVHQEAYGFWKPGVVGSIPARLTKERNEKTNGSRGLVPN